MALSRTERQKFYQSSTKRRALVLINLFFCQILLLLVFAHYKGILCEFVCQIFFDYLQTFIYQGDPLDWFWKPHHPHSEEALHCLGSNVLQSDLVASCPCSFLYVYGICVIPDVLKCFFVGPINFSYTAAVHLKRVIMSPCNYHVSR